MSTIALVPAIPRPAAGETQAPDLATVKARQHGAWSSGDYAVVGTTLQIVGEQLCEALDLRPGQRVLSPPATATRPWRRRGAGRGSSRPIMFRRCSSGGASARRASGSMSSSARPMPRRCPSPMRVST
jgi:hypothetical protein